ncbi:MAG: nucleotidyltransferase domain-containing protein [Treponema sp.]|nr:nucleotidyltransferase domain-containing protein [Treponema sp.]MBR6155064.1 nucleotidyltransferase domain-containing protein [Treponema sp.]
MENTVFSMETIKNRLTPVFSNYKVNSAVIFGSYAKGSATEKSDIDLMVDSRLRGLSFFALQEDIREALDEKEIDLFDVTHINDGSKIQQEIQATGVRIYG